MSNSSSQPIHNKCEICGRQATAGIIDDNKNNDSVAIRYTCEDHYIQLYDRIANDSKK